MNPLIKKQFKQQESQFFEDLFKLLAIPSVRNDQEATSDYPFGPATFDALQALFDLASRDNLAFKNIENVAGHIEFGHGSEIVGIIGHVDVVPGGSDWTITEAFAPLEHQGFIYGRGVSDDKAPVLAAYYAIKLLKESGFQPSKKIRLIIGTDEESNWQCMERYFASEAQPTIGFSPDAAFPIVNSEKGSLSFEILFPEEQGSSPLVSFHSGERRNIVPDYAKATLQAANLNLAKLTTDYQLFLAKEKLEGSVSRDELKDNLIFQLKGTSCHGSLPQNGHNAGTYLASFLAESICPNSAYLTFIKENLHQNFYGNHLGAITNESKELSLNTGVNDYTSKTGGRLEINFRYPQMITTERLISKLKLALPEGTTAVPIGNPKAPHFVAEDSVLVQTLKRVYEGQTGQEATCLTSGGGTFARLATNSVGFGALFPDAEDTMHQANEKMAIADIRQSVYLYAEAIYQLSK